MEPRIGDGWPYRVIQRGKPDRVLTWAELMRTALPPLQVVRRRLENSEHTRSRQVYRLGRLG
jgi:hypothetical protein